MTTIYLENLTRKPLWLRLSTGEHLCVGALETSPGLDDALVDANETLDKLVAQGVIRRFAAASARAAVPSNPSEGAPAAAARTPARRGTRSSKGTRS